MNKPITDRTRSRFFEIAAIVILLSSIFLFGAVQPVVLLSEEFLILLLFMLYMINGLIRGKILDKTPLFLPFMFLLGSMVIQLIPLPFSVVRFISPSTIALREALGAGNGASALSLIPMKTFTQLLRWTTVFLFYLFIVNVFTRKTLPKLLNALFALTCFEVFYGLLLPVKRRKSP